jgi:purine-binding chemotaxis protein CheW
MAENELKKTQDDELLGIYDGEEDEDVQMNKYLSFKINEKIYGIEIKYVNEIIEIQKITEVPDMPQFIKGVINLRGKIIPVMDMRIRFSQEEKEYDDRTCIIIININSIAVGLIVDTVTEVLRIPKENISPPPKFKKGTETRFVSGIGRVGEEVKILLDVEKILYEDELEAITNMNEEEGNK